MAKESNQSMFFDETVCSSSTFSVMKQKKQFPLSETRAMTKYVQWAF